MIRVRTALFCLFAQYSFSLVLATTLVRKFDFMLINFCVANKFTVFFFNLTYFTCFATPACIITHTQVDSSFKLFGGV